MSWPMRALVTAVLYFGTFLAVGYGTRRLLDRWMGQHGEDLDEVQSQAGANRRREPRFLLGIWRK
jgi:hypothetical protein